eukprot:363611-Chlamydomonas_euryale.AAC.1
MPPPVEASRCTTPGCSQVDRGMPRPCFRRHHAATSSSNVLLRIVLLRVSPTATASNNDGGSRSNKAAKTTAAAAAATNLATTFTRQAAMLLTDCGVHVRCRAGSVPRHAAMRRAWGHDELGFKEGGGAVDWMGGGLGLSIVDSLDTLLLMGMTKEYKVCGEREARLCNGGRKGGLMRQGDLMREGAL